MATSTAQALRPRSEPTLATRLARSRASTRGVHLSTDEVPRWLAERGRANGMSAERVPFAELDSWSFDETTGNLGHRSGRFFTVEGLQASIEDATGEKVPRQWSQPILNQPEVGILGLLIKEFDGIPHILMQAKTEPGSPHGVELAPTVQATWSNYTRVHGGTSVRYLEHFNGPDRGPVLADVLQSEQGSWFYRKVNRNLLIEATGEVTPHEDFCWLTLGQLGDLLRMDYLIDMDARSALACLPFERAEPGALHADATVLSWFTGIRARYTVRSRRMPLAEVSGWHRTESTIEHDEGRHFRIVGVDVRAGGREVPHWCQPLLEPCGEGLACFFACRVGSVLHVLAHAHPKGGFVNSVELGPTVAYTKTNYAHLPPAEWPVFAAEAEAAAGDPARVLYSAMLSEEGGRFRNAEVRYLVVDVGEPFTPPPEYCWVTHGQLNLLVRHGHYLNVEARTLLAVLNADF